MGLIVRMKGGFVICESLSHVSPLSISISISVSSGEKEKGVQDKTRPTEEMKGERGVGRERKCE